MLIGFTGLKGSGKDTAAQAVQGVNLKMAGGLKAMLTAFYEYAGLDGFTIQRKIEGDLKEEPCPYLMGATPRWAMQSLGSDWAKMVDPEHRIWVEIWRVAAEQHLKVGHPVVCTDVRFQHELDVIHQLGGRVIRIERPGVDLDDLHESEVKMLGLVVDHTIMNDGSIEDLLNEVTRCIH